MYVYFTNNVNIGNGMGRRGYGRNDGNTNRKTYLRPSGALQNCLRNIAEKSQRIYVKIFSRKKLY